jgi:C-terminal processing protease CtpA/Prc
MRPLRELLHSSAAAAITLGAFGSMAMLMGLRPAIDLTYTTTPPDTPDLIYAADVEHALEVLAALETPVPISEPEPEPEPSALPEIVAEVEPKVEPEVVAEVIEEVSSSAHAHEGPVSQERRATREERLLAARERAASRPPRRRSCVEETDAISELGENHFAVERDLIDYYSSNLKEAAQLAYAHWYREEGEIVGFRVRRIRCGNVLHQAGFRNGDVILSINGRPVTTIPQALLAYRKLRRKKRLSVEVQRRDGQPVELRYKLG